MLQHYEKENRWFLTSSLGPDSPGGRREITEAEGRAIVEEYKRSDERRLEGIERGKQRAVLASTGVEYA